MTEEILKVCEEVVALLKEKKLTVTTAESCTGGLVAASIVGVPGASDVFDAGFVTYANEAKENLVFVSHDTLLKHGAVSPETAGEMAEGAVRRAGAQASIVTTGIAGPGGGTPEKPVGLVYIGTHLCGQTKVKKYNFTGERQEIRLASVYQGVCQLRDMLKEL